ncbi:MAG: cobaltochelatase CobT-related protein [Planctomycetota bacterium]
MSAGDLETTLQKVSRVITHRYGLRLVCEGNRCRTDGRIIYLPSLPDDVPERLLRAIRGWADHECGHALFTRTELGPAFQEEHGRKAFAILNALEDARIEERMAAEYPGSALNIRDSFEFLAEEARGGFSSDPFKHLIAALYTRASSRPDQDWVFHEAYGLADGCEEELSRLAGCRSTDEVADVALAVWEKVKEQVSPAPSSNGREPEGESGGQGSGGPEAEAGSSGTEAGGQPGNSTPRENGEPTASPDASAGHDALAPMDMVGQRIEGVLEESYAAREGSYRIYSTEDDVVEVPEPDARFDPRAEMAELRPYVAGLRRRLLQTLLGRRETRWLGDRTRGRLDPRSLHRLAAARSARVFRQRTESATGRTACTLLLDLSSSMAGQQLDLCRQLALVFSESLSRLAFPTEIIGFSTLDDDRREEIAGELGIELDEVSQRYTRVVPLYHAVFKRFDEPWRTAASRMGHLHARALTPLGESLLFAGRRLASRPESRKVLFCLTDGLPVVGALEEGVTLEHACRAVGRLEAAGIEPVGIGIQENSVEEIFDSHAVISHLGDLLRGFMKKLCAVLSGR